MDINSGKEFKTPVEDPNKVRALYLVR